MIRIEVYLQWYSTCIQRYQHM